MKKAECADMLDRFYSSDKKFVFDVYLKILGREPDKYGLEHYTIALKRGMKRVDMLKDIIQSEEFLHRFITMNLKTLQNLIILKKENYSVVDKQLIYEIKEKEDFDWIETKILDNGYYDRYGVWAYTINSDSSTMAEIISLFQPKLVLEIGCSFGCVMKCLYDIGIRCEGIELSKLAIDSAYSDIKENIYFGDLLNVNLNSNYDLIFALDLFEHLNPNKLKNYLLKIYDILHNDGYLFINVPAFGEDPVFGTIFQLYIDDWKNDITNDRLFSKLPVDEQGYPIHGHLIWAGSNWWVNQFVQYGFQREIEIERVIHTKYDHFIENTSMARKSFYVFSKGRNINKTKYIINKL